MYEIRLWTANFLSFLEGEMSVYAVWTYRFVMECRKFLFVDCFLEMSHRKGNECCRIECNIYSSTWHGHITVLDQNLGYCPNSKIFWPQQHILPTDAGRKSLPPSSFCKLSGHDINIPQSVNWKSPNQENLHFLPF